MCLSKPKAPEPLPPPPPPPPAAEASAKSVDTVDSATPKAKKKRGVSSLTINRSAAGVNVPGV